MGLGKKKWARTWPLPRSIEVTTTTTKKEPKCSELILPSIHGSISNKNKVAMTIQSNNNNKKQQQQRQFFDH